MPEDQREARVKSSTRRSTVACCKRGMPSGAMATKIRSSAAASRHPAAPPVAASSRLSVSVWRTSRARLAPKRQAYGKLPLPGGRPRQQQVRDVGAGDRQHRQHRAQQDPGGQARIVDLAVAQRAHAQLHFFAEWPWHELQRLLEERSQGGGGLRGRHSGLQPRDRPTAHGRSVGGVVALHRWPGVSAHRRVPAWVIRIAAGAHLGCRRSGRQRNGLAHHVPIATEAAHAKDHRKGSHGRGVGPVFVAREVAARNRLDAERGQEIGFHLRACRRTGLAPSDRNR